jgi:hypothetical protein
MMDFPLQFSSFQLVTKFQSLKPFSRRDIRLVDYDAGKSNLDTLQFMDITGASAIE